MILASASPRRQELLAAAGFSLTIEPADIDETRMPSESPCELVGRLATQKAQASLAAHGPLGAGETLLAADTIVWTGDDVLGKPIDQQDARRMLAELSGKTHHVSTGVCLVRATADGTCTTRTFVETTAVTFRTLSTDEINAYVATGEPMDKAGAYGIQGGAGRFVERLDGDYDNVVGLPVARVLEELGR
ncbi:MAG: septum formation inhibitor Maf [Atopobiaceae bacterium]|nr:septum formation inhibitor Maf [Atopobiaceae bacterium]